MEAAGTQSGQSSELFEPLAEIARPILFRQNAFRMVGLFADASTTEIKRRFEQVKMMQKLGTTPSFCSVLPLSPPPDEDQLREALYRLKDPQKALLEALFWFWPVPPEGENQDPALDALTRNDLSAAIASWSEQEAADRNGNLPTHNLAILHHSLALDAEVASKENLHESLQKRDEHWPRAFRAWKHLIDRDAFWGRLIDRIRAFDDPRLTSEIARRLRKDLAVALLSINAQLALQAAERGEYQETERQCGIMNDSGFDPVAVDTALWREIAPLANRIQLLCSQAAKEAKEDVPRSDVVGERLLKQAGVTLNILGHLLSEGDAVREHAYDEVARTVLSIAIAFGNTTLNWPRALVLMHAAEPFAVTVSTKNKMTDNLRIVTKNVEDLRCWFCEKAIGDEKHVLKHPMYGEVKHLGNQITWKKRTIEVSRCTDCAGVHNRLKTATQKASSRGFKWGFWGGFLVTFFWRIWRDLPLAEMTTQMMSAFSARETRSFGGLLRENLFPVLQEIAREHGFTFLVGGGIALLAGVLLCIIGGVLAGMEKGKKTFRRIGVWSFTVIFLGTFFLSGDGILVFELVFDAVGNMPISAFPAFLWHVFEERYASYGVELERVLLGRVVSSALFSMLFVFFARLGRGIKLPEGIKSVSKDRDYPEIKDLQKKGWQFGSEPPAQA